MRMLDHRQVPRANNPLGLHARIQRHQRCETGDVIDAIRFAPKRQAVRVVTVRRRKFVITAHRRKIPATIFNILVTTAQGSDRQPV